MKKILTGLFLLMCANLYAGNWDGTHPMFVRHPSDLVDQKIPDFRVDKKEAKETKKKALTYPGRKKEKRKAKNRRQIYDLLVELKKTGVSNRFLTEYYNRILRKAYIKGQSLSRVFESLNHEDNDALIEEAFKASEGKKDIVHANGKLLLSIFDFSQKILKGHLRDGILLPNKKVEKFESFIDK